MWDAEVRHVMNGVVLLHSPRGRSSRATSIDMIFINSGEIKSARRW